MTESTQGQPLCPFCGNAMLLHDELSKDHVFGDAFGGKVKVLAHKSCNNQSGGGPEGELMAQGTVHNFLIQSQGRGRPVPMTSESGRSAEINLADGKAYSHPNFTRSGSGDLEVLRIEGLADDAERMYESYRAKHPDWKLPPFNVLPPEAVTRTSEANFKVTLTMPPRPAEAVALKVAAGACTVVYGPRFPASPFGYALRERSAALTTVDRRLSVDAGPGRRHRLGGLGCWADQV